MEKFVIWMLVSIGAGPSNVSGPSTTNVIERYATSQDCEETRQNMLIYTQPDKQGLNAQIRCVRSSVVRFKLQQ